MRDQVFITYSHKDKRWLEKLQTMLKPLARKQLAVWDDTQIKAGSKWKDEIQDALAAANVAVLLVSAHFLASDFIANHELPRLLEAAEKDGLVILWIYVSNCLYDRTEIGGYQAAHDVSKPLDSLTLAKQNAVLASVCRKIEAKEQSPPSLDVPTQTHFDLLRSGTPLSSQSSPHQRILYDSSVELNPFSSWTVFSTAGGFEQRISVVPREPDGSPACRLVARDVELVGVNKSLRTLHGRAIFEYKVEFSRSAGLNIFFYMIPMQGRAGLIEVGTDVENDPRNAFSAHRSRLVVPQRYYGDGEWHAGVLDFDFTESPQASYSIFGPRVNEGSVRPASGAVLISKIRLVSSSL